MRGRIGGEKVLESFQHGREYPEGSREMDVDRTTGLATKWADCGKRNMK
jgi:hypothetical protein